MSALDKEISFHKTGKYPQKRSINLYIQEKHTKQNVIALILFGIYLVFLAFFVKYGVLDQIAKINQYEKNYNNTEALLTAMQEQNSNYDEVLAEYSHYGNGYLTDDEKLLQDREDILDVLEKELIDNGALQNVAISGNTATLTFDSSKLSNVSELVQQLESYDIVSYASVSTSESSSDYVASEDGEDTTVVSAVTTTMTIVFNDVSDEESTGETTESTEATTEATETTTESTEGATESATDSATEATTVKMESAAEGSTEAAQ